MRISSSQIHQVAVNAMLDQQSKLSDIQRQVATGQRIFTASDDPVGAARIVDLQQTVDTFDQYQSSIHSGRARLEIEEGILASVVNVLQRVRELTIQANNAIQTNETRFAIGEEIKELNGEMKGLSNSVDSNGDFLFSGSKVKFRPFSDTVSGGFQYNGDDSNRRLQIGPDRQISVGDSGTSVFRTIRNGNGQFSISLNNENAGSAVANPGSTINDYQPESFVLEFKKLESNGEISYEVKNTNGDVIVPLGQKYVEDGLIEFNGIKTSFQGSPLDGDSFMYTPSSNQDVFTTLRDLAESLQIKRNTNSSKTHLANSINQSLVTIDQTIDNILIVRSNTGSRLHALDSQQEINSNHLLHLKEIQSQIKDLDYTEAVTRLNLRLTGLEASQKAYNKVQNLSMFDYI